MVDYHALRWHLQGNIYPPLGAAAVPTATAAIEAAERGDWDAPIELPDGSTVPARELVESWRLEGFITEGGG